MPGFKIVIFSIQSVDAGTMEGPAADLRDAIGTEVELYTANYAEVNDDPHALMHMIERLQEAIDRGLWDAKDEYRETIRDLFLETEELIEEITDR